MKRKQLTAIALSAILSFSGCVPVTGIGVYAAENEVTVNEAVEESGDSVSIGEESPAEEVFTIDPVGTSADEASPITDEAAGDTSSNEAATDFSGDEFAPVDQTPAPEAAIENGNTDSSAAVLEETVPAGDAFDEEMPAWSEGAAAEEPAAAGAQEDTADTDEFDQVQVPDLTNTATEQAAEAGDEFDRTGPQDAEATVEFDQSAPQDAEAPEDSSFDAADSAADLSEGTSESAEIIEPGTTETVKEDKVNGSISATEENFSGANEIFVGDILDLTITSDTPSFFRFTPAETGQYIFSSSSISGNDPAVYLYSEDYEQIGSADDENGNNFRLECTLDAGRTYYLQLYCYGDKAVCQLHVEVNSGNLQANSVGSTYRELLVGAEDVLEVSASSEYPLSYQWYRNGELIDGAGTSSLPIKAEEQDLDTTILYACIVSDGNTSYEIRYYVYVVSYTAERVGDYERYVLSGEETTLEVSVNSDNDTSYQWYDDSARISGATSPSYTFTPEHNGELYCEVLGTGGRASTIYFMIYVDSELTAGPADGITDFHLEKGSSQVLKVEASAREGTEITYKWYDSHWNELENPSSDPSAFTVDDLQSYRGIVCQVTDQYGNTSNIWFSLYVQGDLLVWPDTESMEDTSTTLSVSRGEDAYLLAHNNSGFDVSYSWYDEADELLSETTTDNSYTVTNVQKRQTIRCRAFETDNPDNFKDVYFCIKIYTDFQAYPEGNDIYDNTAYINLNNSPIIR